MYRDRGQHGQLGKRDKQFYAAKQPVCHSPRNRGTILGNPAKDVFEISNRLIVEDEFHWPLRTQPSDAFQRFSVGQQFAVRIGSAAANLGHLCVGQAHVLHMFDIVEQRAGRSVLLAFRQLLNLSQGLFE
jgi:hypothetical protein